MVTVLFQRRRGVGVKARVWKNETMLQCNTNRGQRFWKELYPRLRTLEARGANLFLASA